MIYLAFSRFLYNGRVKSESSIANEREITRTMATIVRREESNVGRERNELYIELCVIERDTFSISLKRVGDDSSDSLASKNDGPLHLIIEKRIIVS